jgi:hypothetical protein
MNKLIEKLKIIHAIEPNIIVGGSLALQWQGLMNRDIKDLDLIFHSDNPEDKIIPNRFLSDFLKLQNNVDDRSQRESDILDVALTCQLEDVGVDIFLDDFAKYSDKIILEKEVDNTKFKYLDWTYIVPFKIKYYTGNSKHYKDIEYIKNILDMWIAEYGLIHTSLESQVYKQINEFLDNNENYEKQNTEFLFSDENLPF